MMVMHQCILTAKPNLPWLNHEITKGMHARNLAFRRVKRTGRSNHLNDYKKKCNKVANMIKSAKSKFFMGLNPSNPKGFWKVTKYLTKQTSSIPILKDCDGNAIHDDEEKATLLNEFFSRCFNSAQPPLCASDLENLSQLSQDLCPEQYLCSEDEVLKKLLSLDTSKSNGPDGISATMMKATAASIAPGIANLKLINKFISSGVFPTAWKTSSVVPIPKGKDRTSVSNYRPISLLPILSKVLEKHIHKLVSAHLKLCYPIVLQQLGFQPKKSTVSALLDVSYN